MNTTLILRINNEMKMLNEQKEQYKSMLELAMVGDDAYHWEGTIYGPHDSLYENCSFKLDIKLPSEYPYKPPNVKFISKIQHVNVNTQGDICLDILKTAWKPSMSMVSVLISIIALLDRPNVDDPLNSDLADLFRKNPEKYVEIIKSTNSSNLIKVN